MKKYVSLLLLLFVWIPLSASVHPQIYVSNADKTKIKEKIATCQWAKTLYNQLQNKIDPYVERHKTDPQWIVSRLAMYWKEGEHYTQCYLKKQNWDRGEGNAPVPTVRMPGMRTWNKYDNVPLAERTPYNETGDMWGINILDPSAPKKLIPYKESGHMIRKNNVEILTLAEEASFLYWITGEERYAAFATDIFNTWLIGTYYMNPILDPEQSAGGPGGYEPGGICGYYDYEQIHDDLAMHAAVIYDFTYEYLQSHLTSDIMKTGKSLTDVAGIVFKRFIDIGFVRGGKSGNWNVNGWNIMLRPILALEDNDFYPDGKGRSYYLHFLTTESTPYHDAIPEILKTYNPVTGLWPESPGYSFGTIAMLLDFSSMLNRHGIDIIAANPILYKAALAVFPWMDERANMIVFGDSRGGTANFKTFENLLAYHSQTGNTANRSQVVAALNTGIASGQYHRENADWTALCQFVADIPKTKNNENERMSYSPFHRLVTMKSQQCDENLMAILYGGRNGSHLSPNGLALQLYGFGYALAPDAAGYESYWSADHAYHQTATGSNTILPGYTEGDISIRAMEPFIDSTSFTNAQSVNPNINVCDMEASEKRRVVAIIKTSPSTGYYVDIFRSNLNDNDYLFHDVGVSLSLMDKDGHPLTLNATDSIGKTYSNGYKWFRNPKKASYSQDFSAVWNVTNGQQPLSMRMWMTGGEGRELYSLEAPHTTIQKGITPENVSMAPGFTPTLLVRQNGNNAWTHPFMAVFQPIKGTEASVKAVKQIVADDEKAALLVSSNNERKDYILSGTTADVAFAPSKNIAFKGMFGLITETSGKTEQLYMVNATTIKNRKYSIQAENPVSASIYLKDGQWFYSCSGKASIKIEKNTYNVNEGYNIPLKP